MTPDLYQTLTREQLYDLHDRLIASRKIVEELLKERVLPHRCGWLADRPAGCSCTPTLNEIGLGCSVCSPQESVR